MLSRTRILTALALTCLLATTSLPSLADDGRERARTPRHRRSSPPWGGAGPNGVSAPSGAVNIAAGTDRILGAIARHPRGTVFRLRNGTHYLTETAIPKSKQQFWAEDGGKVVITRASGSKVNSAFGGGASGVRLVGLTIKNFGDGARVGAIHSGGSGWKIRRNDIGPNAGFGLMVGSHTTVRDNRVHHSAILGVSGGGTGSLFQGNVIAFNNTGNHDWFYEAGGSKFVSTTDLVVRGNWVHDNVGPGLWTDGDNLRTVYARNRVEDNKGAGIFHEISCGAVIRDNKVIGNGRAQDGIWYAESGILVSTSVNVEIFGNHLRGNGGGIGLMNRVDPNPGRCARDLKDAFVHDNVIRMDRGVTGLVSNDDGDLPYTTWHNRFRNNTYQLDELDAMRFEWRTKMSKKQWRAAGHDTTGTFKQL